MRLSELENIIEIKNIKHDIEFNSLGMISTTYEKDDNVLTFLQDDRFLNFLYDNDNIKALICTESVYRKIDIDKLRIGILISDNPKKVFFDIHNYLNLDTNFYKKDIENKIHYTAKIHPSVILNGDNIRIGENTEIGPNTVIYSNTKIGSNVKIQSNITLGGDGFQYIQTSNERIKVYSAGGVYIEDNVEILSNTCIEKGIFGKDTILKKGCKLDHLVLIGHDSIIGENTLIVGSAMISGRVYIGKNSYIGSNSTISNGIKVGDNAKVSMGAVVTKDIENNETVSGNFEISHTKFIEFMKTIR